VKGCEVTASSGSSDLDAATCANVAKRARFNPATDESGARVAGSYSSAVRWEIPD
jgi:protein TonB